MFHKRSVRAMLAEELLNILAKLRTRIRTTTWRHIKRNDIKKKRKLNFCSAHAIIIFIVDVTLRKPIAALIYCLESIYHSLNPFDHLIFQAAIVCHYYDDAY